MLTNENLILKNSRYVEIVLNGNSVTTDRKR